MANSSTQNFRVLHVAESFASGVANVIVSYAKNTPDVSHSLMYSQRADAPLDEALIRQFAQVQALPRGHFARVRAIREEMRRGRYNVIHMHSSLAGAYGRLATLRSSAAKRIYTPHCFAFERVGQSRAQSWGAHGVEWFLGRLSTDAFAACSAREAELARRIAPKVDVVEVPNVMPTFNYLNHDQRGSRVCVITTGRLSEQKDPSFYARVALVAGSRGLALDFKWLGGFDERWDAELQAAAVQQTGWLPADSVVKELAAADIYLHVAQWEGYPLGVLEAVAAGLPVLIRDRPYALDSPLDARFDSVDAAVDRLEKLLGEDSRQILADRWLENLAENTPAAQAARLRTVYGIVTQPDSLSMMPKETA